MLPGIAAVRGNSFYSFYGWSSAVVKIGLVSTTTSGTVASVSPHCVPHCVALEVFVVCWIVVDVWMTSAPVAFAREHGPSPPSPWHALLQIPLQCHQTFSSPSMSCEPLSGDRAREIAFPRVRETLMRDVVHDEYYWLVL